MAYPNRLVRVRDIEDLVSKIDIVGGDGSSLELPRREQMAERRRLAGAVEPPNVELGSDGLKISWRGGDGRDYRAALVGVDSSKNYAIVTDVVSQRSHLAGYREWQARSGPYF